MCLNNINMSYQQPHTVTIQAIPVEDPSFEDMMQRQRMERLMAHSIDCSNPICVANGCHIMKKIIYDEAMAILRLVQPRLQRFIEIRQLRKKFAHLASYGCRLQNFFGHPNGYNVEFFPGTQLPIPDFDQPDCRFAMRFRLRVAGYCHAVIQREGDNIGLYLLFSVTPEFHF
ncbi:hypothetical protein L596_005529 [Steinernema carpocapsae]|uniref:Uncharacterized protein n=1 Tax=Steinernema carpocapsae TaxID=34508 RepID=A0A4U8V0R5_STECR|nr:hypothetical protein L596_005529 [Steinernema carpocapsae]